MTNNNNRAQNNFIKVIKQPLVLAVLLALVTSIIIAGIVVYGNFRAHTVMARYEIIGIESINKYDAHQYHGQVYMDVINIPTPEKRGLSIELGQIEHAGFVELYLKENGNYLIQLLKKGEIIEEMSAATYSASAHVIALSEDTVSTGYDSIRISPSAGKYFAVGYVNILAKFDDNVVLKPLEEAGYVLPFTGEASAISEPYKVTGILAYYLESDENKFSIEVANVHDRSVELIGIKTESGVVLVTFDEDSIIEADRSIAYHTYTFEDMQITIPLGLKNLYVSYKVEGATDIKIEPLTPYKRMDEALFSETGIRTTDNVADFPDLVIIDGVLKFESEMLIIDHPLFIPDNITFQLSEGQRIDLINEAFIVSYAPIMAEGTEEEPIIIGTSDGTGRGLAVIKAMGESIITYARFEGLNTPVSGAWQLTGSVTFYESDVRISNSLFADNVCEDGLNVVRSTFLINESIFRNTYGDAFDADFSTGSFTNTRFSHTGNDAFDVSTSDITLAHMIFEDIGDKAISIGENSVATISDIQIDGAVIAIASKDYSKVIGRTITIENSEIAYGLYQKKPEFGPASIDVKDVTLIGDIGLEYLIEPGSTLYIDGIYQEPKSASKESLLIEKIVNGEPIK
ncbi:MAG: hypothetical protein PF505_10090 [Vallitaleaceae bacterium]|jgi:hypothetical protein|nr:hypothetical protein [Vallitaleaceae bacterium]